MKIENCGEDRLKITLGRNDLHDMSISFDELDYAKMETRRMIWELLDQANRQTGFDSTQGRLMIEALPMIDGGCVLYFTVLPRDNDTRQRAGRMHLRRLNGPYIYEFGDVDCMMAAAGRLHNEFGELVPKSSLYLFDGKYRLVLYTRTSAGKKPDVLLSEYGKSTGEGETAAAFTAEHGQALAEGDALLQIVGSS